MPASLACVQYGVEMVIEDGTMMCNAMLDHQFLQDFFGEQGSLQSAVGASCCGDLLLCFGSSQQQLETAFGGALAVYNSSNNVPRSNTLNPMLLHWRQRQSVRMSRHRQPLDASDDAVASSLPA